MDHYKTSSHGRAKNNSKIANDKILIKGGRIVNHDYSHVADLYIENGIIKQVGNEQATPGGVTVINAQGSLVLPGGIDTATFFETKPNYLDKKGSDDMVSIESFYSGSKAALAGGTTTIMDFVNCDKGHLVTELESRKEIAEKSCCNVSFHADVTSWNDKVMADMTSLATDSGVNSFRVHMSDKGQLSDAQIYDIFTHIKKLGCVAIVHAENGDLIRKNLERLKENGHNGPESIMYARNEDVECDAVRRAITIAKQVSCPLFFWNVTGKPAIDSINEAKSKGFPVYAQTLAVGLSQDGSCYLEASWEKASAHLTFPPLRKGVDAKDNLLTALSSDVLSCIASGHAAFNSSQKALYGKKNCNLIPPGTNGVYERLMTLWATSVNTGMMSENEFVACTSTNAAKIFNMYPRKGHLIVGADADVVIWNPKARRSIAQSATSLGIHRSDAENAFIGLESSGGPQTVICRGRIVFNSDEMNVIQGWGEVVGRPTRPPLMYNRLEMKDKLWLSKNSPIIRTGVTSSVESPSVNGITSNLHDADIDSDSPRYSRGSGQRSMHQSGWSFSGDQAGDQQQRKTGHKILGPPGGRSNILSLG